MNEEQGKKEKLEASAQKKKTNRKRKLSIFIMVAVMLIALIMGLGIYNTPENRLARQLDLGIRYLEGQNYKEAVLAFEKAIQIDERCMSAYDNGIQAYLNLDEPENLRTFYGKALDAARLLDGEALDADAEAIVSIYLAAMDVYGDTDRALELWEEGYEKSGQDERLRDSLVDTYLERAKGLTADENYEESLRDYDRMLELDGQNDEVQKGLADCLKEYLDLLMEQGDFARVQELTEKYASALQEFDFAAYLDEIALWEQMETDNRAFLQRIYELMSAENYEGMIDLYLESENEDMLIFEEQLERMKAERYLYFPEGIVDQTGIGVGFYRNPNCHFLDVDTEGVWAALPYYVYYGPYKNGSREGEGIFFWVSEAVWTFSGTWIGDAPNGKGKLSDDYSLYTSRFVAEGNLVDGLWNGRVDAHINDNSGMGPSEGDVSFIADMGVPQDRTDEFLTQPGIDDGDVAEGAVYAYDFIDQTLVWVSYYQGYPLGVFGFGELPFCTMRSSTDWWW